LLTVEEKLLVERKVKGKVVMGWPKISFVVYIRVGASPTFRLYAVAREVMSCKMMLAGGHVMNGDGRLVVLLMVAYTMVEPGRAAVANPLTSTVPIVLSSVVYVMAAGGIVLVMSLPWISLTTAMNCSVNVVDTQGLVGGVCGITEILAIGLWMFAATGGLVTPGTIAVIFAL